MYNKIPLNIKSIKEAKAEDKKKSNEDKDEKQYIIDCIKMVVYCD